MILDDLANEFSPFSPTFGEKYAPPFMPVSLRDQAGREFSRVYSDRFGTYNALVPSTFSLQRPDAVGRVAEHGAGLPEHAVHAGSGERRQVQGSTRYFNKSYTQYCYTFQYLPGKTTYLDTPVLPIAAFAGPQQFPLDCEAPSATPEIHSVTNGAGQGPWVPAAGQTITITSLGPTQVLNPLYNQDNPSAIGPNGVVEPKTIARDFGFGAEAGQVLFVSRAGTPFETVLPVAPTSWSDSQITVLVPDLGAGVNSATVLVRRAGPNGRTTPRGVTVHVGGPAPTVVTAAAGQKKIQAAIDAATTAGALITVAPGVYEESVILNKRLRLQGFGAGSTFINAIKQPTETQQQWRERVCDILFTETNGARLPAPGPGAAGERGRVRHWRHGRQRAAAVRVRRGRGRVRDAPQLCRRGPQPADRRLHDHGR